MRELDQLREVFLTDVDEETEQENLERLSDWERSLRDNKAFSDWQSLEITASILEQTKETYRDIAIQLSENRKLSEAERQVLWARQDAAEWLVQLMGRDAKAELHQVESEIKRALSATKNL